jgi:hypothetical protein
MQWTPNGGWLPGESVEVYVENGQALRTSGEPRHWARRAGTATADNQGRISHSVTPTPGYPSRSAIAVGLTSKRCSATTAWS